MTKSEIQLKRYEDERRELAESLQHPIITGDNEDVPV